MSSDEEENNNEEEQEAWVRIQESTFTNWVNDKLRRYDVEVTHLQRDFRDGVNLCKLVETLVDRPIGRVITKKNLNFYQASGNIAIALEAIKQSGVRLVNIGKCTTIIRVGNGALELCRRWVRHAWLRSTDQIYEKFHSVECGVNATAIVLNCNINLLNWNVNGSALHQIHVFCYKVLHLCVPLSHLNVSKGTPPSLSLPGTVSLTFYNIIMSLHITI